MEKSRQKVLFVTPILHHPPIGGSSLRIENSIKALSQISDLFIYSRVSLDALGGENSLFFYRKYCKYFHFGPFVDPKIYMRFVKRIINLLVRRPTRIDLFDISSEVENDDCRYLLFFADIIRADVIWLGYGNISYKLLKYIKSHSQYKVVLDTDSVWSRFILRKLPYSKNPEECKKIVKLGREKEREEKWGTQLANVTTAVSEVDANYYRNYAKSSQQVHLFPNVIDLGNYKNIRNIRNSRKNIIKPCIYLAGTFGQGSPMEDAARWVINKILPIVWLQISNLHFYIIGSGSDTTLADIKNPHISVMGQVQSVLPLLCNVNVSIVPLRFESGTRFKILEAAACNVPIVSTTLGAEGLPVVNGENILIADDYVSFANSIVKLIRNKKFANKIAKNLHKMVVNKYNISSLAEYGSKILEYLID